MPSCANTDGDIMKSKRRTKFLKKLKRKDPPAIPSAEWPHEKELTEIVSSLVDNKLPVREVQATQRADAEVPAAHLKALVSIATNAWRAKTKMLNAATGEVREDMKRVDRHIEAIYRNLAELGIVIRDHTRDAYDEGQPMRVIANKVTPELERKRVSETLLPSIFWKNRLVQNGEIEIETPATANSPAEAQNH